MKDSGIIFKRVSRGRRTLTNLGRGLTLGAILTLSLAILLPTIIGKQEAKQRLEALRANNISFGDLLRIEAENSARVNQATYFALDIPKIQAQSQVIANVDATDKKVYTQALKQGVAHAAGTFLPGMGGSVTLFAHSTDISANVSAYNALFYRLDELVAGDIVTLWYLGEKLTYQVTSVKVTPPDDVSVFVKEDQGDKLYLVTCTPRGTTKNRLIVETKLI